MTTTQAFSAPRLRGTQLALDANGLLDGRREASSPPARREVEVCKRYIKTVMEPAPSVRVDRTSYGLKHDAERWSGEYVSNGAFIQAALELDVDARPCKPPAAINAVFALRPKRARRRRP